MIKVSATSFRSDRNSHAATHDQWHPNCSQVQDLRRPPPEDPCRFGKGLLHARSGGARALWQRAATVRACCMDGVSVACVWTWTWGGPICRRGAAPSAVGAAGARSNSPSSPPNAYKNPDLGYNQKLWCAVKRRWFSAGAIPARQRSLRPVALGAADGGNAVR